MTRIAVRTTPDADVQIREALAWWRANRPSAAELFVDELARAFTMLAEAPAAGVRYSRSKVPGVRRLLLPRTRYHVYYVQHEDVVLVLAVWSAVRGRGPHLRP